ncbi:uncharacterized protein TNCV_4473391 [Trichonephila clavipes]|uniref:Uncharacterized protein n=1 Tax=Trichonephila clavipes TaxID=2585209 RepID=A0A8X6SFM8_TRICX|nr:uncharacterized protein TNCV_4473391 [Trichonephila clavipes]
MLNDDDNVTSLQEESDSVDDETDDDEDNNTNKSSKGSSNAEAFSALVIALEWYEEQSECCLTQLLLLKRIRDQTKVCRGKEKNKIIFHNKGKIATLCTYFASSSLFPACDDFQYSYSVWFHILHGSHSVFGYPNNRLSERCLVPFGSDKRRSTVNQISRKRKD